MLRGRDADTAGDFEATGVATIRKRRRVVNDADALAIRHRKMMEMRIHDGLDDSVIADVFGLSERSVREGVRRAKEEVRRLRQEAG